jgi:hypothetical protein
MRLIDADALKREPELLYGLTVAITEIQDVIYEAPTVEERKHGRWIELEPDKYGNFIQCSVCDSKFGLYSKDNYCQACGAIMENNGDDDDE